jgi:hypothetical protein
MGAEEGNLGQIINGGRYGAFKAKQIAGKKGKRKPEISKAFYNPPKGVRK